MPAFGANDLVMTAGLPFTKVLTFTDNGAPGDWSLYNARMQVRHPFNDDLLIELTALLSVAEDTTRLVLALPADLTSKLPEEGRWDILAQRIDNSEYRLRFPRPPGRFLVLRGVTRD